MSDGSEAKIFVGNLPFATSEDTLREYFAQFGNILDGKCCLLLVLVSFAGPCQTFGTRYDYDLRVTSGGTCRSFRTWSETKDQIKFVHPLRIFYGCNNRREKLSC